jgi:hypothetical protein
MIFLNTYCANDQQGFVHCKKNSKKPPPRF